MSVEMIGSTREGRPHVLARFATAETARRAIERLEARGIDGHEIELVGPRAPVPVREREDSDEEFMWRTTRWVLLGVVLGALGGGLLGVIGAGTELLVWPGGLSHG